MQEEERGGGGGGGGGGVRRGRYMEDILSYLMPILYQDMACL